MTDIQRSKIKDWLSLANIIVLIGLIFKVGFFVSSSESKDDYLEKMFNEHIRNEEMHMPLEKRIEIFVAIQKLSSDFENVKEAQTEVLNQIKELRKEKY